MKKGRSPSEVNQRNPDNGKALGYNVDKEEICIDRRNSGETSFNEFFSPLDLELTVGQ